MHASQQQNVTAEEMTSRARDLADHLMAHASRIEQEGRIPEDIAERLVEAGMFRITAPVELGGLGLSPDTLWKVVLEIASGCASTAWVTSLVGANVLMLARFPEAVRAAMCDRGPPILTLLTGGATEGVCARRVSGGMLLSGQWRYASGIDIATWTGLLVNVQADGAAPAAPTVVLVPTRAFTIDHTSWNVLGMRGTGSKRIALRETFVPDDFCIDWNLMQQGGRADTVDGVRQFPLNVLFAMSVFAPTLGASAAVVQEARQMLRSADDKRSQINLASALATLDLLETNLLADTDRITRRLRAGAEVDVSLRALVRMKIAVSSRYALQTAQAVLAEIGGGLLPQGTRIERGFRDVHAMSTHFLLQPAPNGEAYGRLVLGLGLPAGARV